MRTTLNEVRLIGTLADDTQFLTNEYGEMAIIKLDIRQSWTNKETAKIESKTETHTISVFHEPSIKSLKEKIKKGTPIIVKGSLQARPYTLESGEARSASRAVVGKYDGGIGTLYLKPTENFSGTPAQVYAQTFAPSSDDTPF